MNRPARLPVDCPRCENRSVLALDDDRTIACPLCNNWCSLCLDGVPTFVHITRPYRGSLIAGMRPTIDEDTARQAIAPIDTRPMGRSSIPVQQSLLHG
jgi:hypothetical protein